MNFGHVSAWILTGGTAMLFIIGAVTLSKWIGSKNIPVLSNLSNGLVSAWKAAA